MPTTPLVSSRHAQAGSDRSRGVLPRSTAPRTMAPAGALSSLRDRVTPTAAWCAPWSHGDPHRADRFQGRGEASSLHRTRCCRYAPARQGDRRFRDCSSHEDGDVHKWLPPPLFRFPSSNHARYRLGRSATESLRQAMPPGMSPCDHHAPAPRGCPTRSEISNASIVVIPDFQNADTSSQTSTDRQQRPTRAPTQHR